MSVNITYLGISPYTPTVLPTEQSIVEAGRTLFKDLASWKPVKTFKSRKGHHPYLVQTFVKPKAPVDEVPWFMRYSVHKPQEDGTFDDFWNLLGKNKAINEKEFIPEIKSVALLKTISPTQSIWTLHYTFTPPVVSPRTFTVLQVVHISGGEHGQPREGWIISVPVDVSEDPEMKAKEVKAVRGRYASVEVLKEKEDGTVEWRMATASTPGGLIPKAIAQKSIPGQIEKDVGHFLDWLQIKRKSATPPPTIDAVPAPAEPVVEPADEPVAAAEINGDPEINGNPEPNRDPESYGDPAVEEELSVDFGDETTMINAPPEQTTAPTGSTMPSDAPATAEETMHL